MSGRMAALWSLASVRESVVLEFGCMGHMNYGRMFLHRMGVNGGKIYSTHIGEIDIAMGDWARLCRAVCQIVKQDKPKAIFLLPSSVPEIIGIDLKAIAYELSNEYTDIQVIPISCGSFDADGSLGVEKILLQLAQVFPKAIPKTDAPSFNIIGSCADMFNFHADAAELCRIMDITFSMKPVCIMTSSASISEMERMSSAHVNLVIRREGEHAAEQLRVRFGTPYITMRPYGVEGTLSWLREIEALCGITANADYVAAEAAICRESLATMLMALGRYMRMHPEQSRLILAGHADVIEGIAHFGRELSVFSNYDLYCNYSRMSNNDMPYLDEGKRACIGKDHCGFLMGDEMLLSAAGRHESLQISNPDSGWRHGYEPPLMGFRGAVHLGTILTNEMVRKA